MKDVKKFQKLAENFNKEAFDNRNREYSKGELMAALKARGLSNDLVSYLIKTDELNIRKNQRGKQFYSFKRENLTYDKIQAYYEGRRIAAPSEADESKALAILKTMGYQIKKCIGFDEKKFSKDHPELYKQYLIYEQI